MNYDLHLLTKSSFNNIRDQNQDCLEMLSELLKEIEINKNIILTIFNNLINNFKNGVEQFEKENKNFENFIKENNNLQENTKMSDNLMKSSQNLIIQVENLRNYFLEVQTVAECIPTELVKINKDNDKKEEKKEDYSNLVVAPMKFLKNDNFSVRENAKIIINQLIKNEEFKEKEIQIIIPKRLPKLVRDMKSDLDNELYLNILFDKKYSEIYERVFLDKEWKAISRKLTKFITNEKINKSQHSGNVQYIKMLMKKYYYETGYDYIENSDYILKDLKMDRSISKSKPFKIKVIPESMNYFLKYEHKNFTDGFFQWYYSIQKRNAFYYYGFIKNRKNIFTYFYTKAEKSKGKDAILLFEIKEYWLLEDALMHYDEDKVYDENVDELMKKWKPRIETVADIRYELARLIFLEAKGKYLSNKK